MVFAPWRGGAGTLQAVRDLVHAAPTGAPAAAPAAHEVEQLDLIVAELTGQRCADDGSGLRAERSVDGDRVTDGSPYPVALCAAIRAILEHGLIGLDVARRIHAPGSKALARVSAWRVVKQELPRCAASAAHTVSHICALRGLGDAHEYDRLEPWIRHALNCCVLADAIGALGADASAMTRWYDPTAAMRQPQLLARLTATLRTLSQVAFQLSLTTSPWDLRSAGGGADAADASHANAPAAAKPKDRAAGKAGASDDGADSELVELQLAPTAVDLPAESTPESPSPANRPKGSAFSAAAIARRALGAVPSRPRIKVRTSGHGAGSHSARSSGASDGAGCEIEPTLYRPEVTAPPAS